MDGNTLKERGIAQVASHNQEWLGWARETATTLVRRHGYVSADDIRFFAEVEDYFPDHPNAWGAIFKGKEWKPVGWKPSCVTSNRGRAIRVWTLA